MVKVSWQFLQCDPMNSWLAKGRLAPEHCYDWVIDFSAMFLSDKLNAIRVVNQILPLSAILDLRRLGLAHHAKLRAIAKGLALMSLRKTGQQNN
jgi:hypothetical protein